MAQVLDLGNVMGPQGPSGTDGKSILYGTTAPTTQGVNGDLYLNVSNWDMYAKESGSWVKKGNIKGATGAQGTKGDTGLQGAKGDKGDKGDTGAAGPVPTFTVNASGHLIATYE